MVSSDPMYTPYRELVQVTRTIPHSRYRTLWRHATGGLGEVFAAPDDRIEPAGGAQTDSTGARGESAQPKAVYRRSRDHRAASNIPASFRFTVWRLTRQGQPCYAMRFVEGETLRTPSIDFTRARRRFPGLGVSLAAAAIHGRVQSGCLCTQPGDPAS